MSSFTELKISGWLVRTLTTINITKPTPIQENCIPKILEGKDCIGAAKTGSGKTLAFALPILNKLAEDPYGVFALILTPTRELAYQISESFAVLGKNINLRQSVLVGGIDIVDQGLELTRKPHIVIATPGRFCDLLSSEAVSLKKLKFFVLDEADRLLSGAYDDEIKSIFQAVPKSRQTLLFSATMNDTLETVMSVAKSEVFMWIENSKVATVEQLKQYFIMCPPYVKDGYLVELLRLLIEENEKMSIIVFTDTCKNCQILSMTLNELGFENVALHGMIPQKQRIAALTAFKSYQTPVLLATNVASRGLDIPLVDVVINAAIPIDPKIYIHRVGRTARAGKEGRAYTLLGPSEIKVLQAIEATIKTKLEKFQINSKSVSKIFTQVSVTRRECEVKLDQSEFYERREINKRKDMILEGKDPDLVSQNRAKMLKKKEKELRRNKLKRLQEMRNEIKL